MRVKRGVTYSKLCPQAWFALGVAEAVYKQHGFTLRWTSGDDSHAHRPKSLHNTGMAVDLGIRAIPATTLGAIVRDLTRILDPQGYDVVPESDHVHVEHQPKEAEIWLETVA